MNYGAVLCYTVRARTYVYIAQSGVLPHVHLPVCTNLQSVIYDLVAAAFKTGEDRHVILILASVA